MKETADANGVGFHIFGYGAWYQESLEYLNDSGGEYNVPLYPTGLGSTEAAILEDGSTTRDPKQLFTTAGAGQIPVVMVIDVEGHIVERQATETPIAGGVTSIQLSRTQ